MGEGCKNTFATFFHVFLKVEETEEEEIMIISESIAKKPDKVGLHPGLKWV